MFGFAKKKSTLELLLEEDEANSQEIVLYPLATSPTFTPATSPTFNNKNEFIENENEFIENENEFIEIESKQNTIYNIRARNVYINTKKKKKKKKKPTPLTPDTNIAYGCNFEEGWSDTYCDTFCSYCEGKGAVYEDVEPYKFSVLDLLPDIIAFPFLMIGEVLGKEMEEPKRRNLIENTEDEVIELETEDEVIELEVVEKKEVTFKQATFEEDNEIERLKKELEIARLKEELEITELRIKLFQNEDEEIEGEVDSYANMMRMNPQFKRA